MSATEEATVNPDGSTTFETPGAGGEEQFQGDAGGVPPEEVMEEIVKGTDPALYLLIVVALVGFAYYWFILRKKNDEEEDDFFSNLDGDKVRTVDCDCLMDRMTRDGFGFVVR
jgi:hypothetical protein